MFKINGRVCRSLEEQVLDNAQNIETLKKKKETARVYFLKFEGAPEIGAEVEIPIQEIIDSVSPDKFGGVFPVIFTPYYLSPAGEAESVTDYYQMSLYRIDFEHDIVYFSRKRANGDGYFIIKLTKIDDNHAIYDEENQIVEANTFIATYGSTTYNEVTNAVLNKKLIYCVHPAQGAFEYIYVGVVDSKRTFVAANPKGGYKVLTLDSANNWASNSIKIAADDVIICTTQTTVQSNIIRIDETLDLKQDKLTAGTGITIQDNVISASGGGGGNTKNFTGYAEPTTTESQVYACLVNMILKDESTGAYYDTLTWTFSSSHKVYTFRVYQCYKQSAGGFYYVLYGEGRTDDGKVIKLYNKPTGTMSLSNNVYWKIEA